MCYPPIKIFNESHQNRISNNALTISEGLPAMFILLWQLLRLKTFMPYHNNDLNAWSA